MDIYTATEQAYKNGYENGIKALAKRINKQNGNAFIEEWYESADICYAFNQSEFQIFIDDLVKELLKEVER